MTGLSSMDQFGRKTRDEAAQMLTRETGYSTWPDGHPLLELTALLLHGLKIYADPDNWCLAANGHERIWIGYPPDGGASARKTIENASQPGDL